MDLRSPWRQLAARAGRLLSGCEGNQIRCLQIHRLPGSAGRAPCGQVRVGRADNACDDYGALTARERDSDSAWGTNESGPPGIQTVRYGCQDCWGLSPQAIAN